MEKLQIVIPMHYPQGSSAPDEFARHVHEEAPDSRVVILKPGDSFIHTF